MQITDISKIECEVEVAALLMVQHVVYESCTTEYQEFIDIFTSYEEIKEYLLNHHGIISLTEAIDEPEDENNAYWIGETIDGKTYTYHIYWKSL